ncbi:MAG: heme exporter protein CcmD [Gammaproteobacteria bacterium]|nr:heme exporter protein CcmD [Gammaproteobacteria bacterium]MBU1776688.1 heme exporter protein CcmD [Gammaproteobacteria bacterium]MBU1968664.1 heme exporter protein CcmD [Gammaproteobacteria bacterium]
MNWGDFFAMNGYAFYVWGSYGVTVLVFAVEALMARNRRNNILRELRLMRMDMEDNGNGEQA